MPKTARVTVAILYEHPLLGEGIASYLRATTGVEATLIRADNLAAVRAGLATDPGVVIFERSAQLRDIDLAALAPHAAFFDISTVVGAASAGSCPPARFEQILRVVVGSVAQIETPAR